MIWQILVKKKKNQEKNFIDFKYSFEYHDKRIKYN